MTKTAIVLFCNRKEKKKHIIHTEGEKKQCISYDYYLGNHLSVNGRFSFLIDE